MVNIFNFEMKKIVGVFMYFKIRASIYLTQMVVSK